MSQPLVLLTGATGHIGFHILTYALDHGYSIRAAVRSDAKAKSLAEAEPVKSRNPGERLTFVNVPDLLAPGAYDEAVKGVQYIIHVASPLPGNQSTRETFESEIIEPAVKGTLGILESAKKTSGIKRIVITSSMAALVSSGAFGNPSEQIFTAENRVKTPAIEHISQAFQAYGASKIKAFNEAEAWVKREKPEFDLIHIHPSFVLGPDELQPSRKALMSGGTNRLVLNVAAGDKVAPPTGSTTVHVDDVASVHVRSLEPQIPGNTSFLVTYNSPDGKLEGSDFSQVPSIVAKHFPEAIASGVLPNKGTQPSVAIRLDASKTEEAFGFKHLSFEQQVKDVVAQYVALGA